MPPRAGLAFLVPSRTQENVGEGIRCKGIRPPPLEGFADPADPRHDHTRDLAQFGRRCVFVGDLGASARTLCTEEWLHNMVRFPQEHYNLLCGTVKDGDDCYKPFRSLRQECTLEDAPQPLLHISFSWHDERRRQLLQPASTTLAAL